MLALIDGKTIGEFTVAAMDLNIPAPLRNRLLDATDLIPSWLEAGKITTDGDTHKVV